MKHTKAILTRATVAVAILVIPSHLSATVEDKLYALSEKCKSGKQSACSDLARIALTDPAPHVRGYAAHYVTDQLVLAKIAVEEKDVFNRVAVVERLTDQSLLKKIALGDEDPEVSEAAKRTMSAFFVEAAGSGDAATVQSLLAWGVWLNTTDQAHFTALMRASMNGRIEMAQFLIQKGADVNASANDPDYVQMSNGAIAYPRYNYPSAAAELAAQTGGVVVHGNRNTALLLARKNGHQEISDLLIKAGAK